MGNSISEKYSQYHSGVDFDAKLKKAVADLKGLYNIKVLGEYSRNKIFFNHKTWSVVLNVTYNEHLAVLKINFLKPEYEECDIQLQFKEVVNSSKVRLPKLIIFEKYNKNRGYGYLIGEYVHGGQLHSKGLLNDEKKDLLFEFFADYFENVSERPFYEKELQDENSLILTLKRVTNWYQIALDNNYIDSALNKIFQGYIEIAQANLMEIPVEFMHGHLSTDRIWVEESGGFVLMTNLYWLYRPRYYDAAYNIWYSILSNTDKSLGVDDFWAYIKDFERRYKRLDKFKNDPLFRKGFYLMLMERFIGSLLVDISADDSKTEQEKTTMKLIFEDLFNNCKQEVIMV